MVSDSFIEKLTEDLNFVCALYLDENDDTSNAKTARELVEDLKKSAELLHEFVRDEHMRANYNHHNY